MKAKATYDILGMTRDEVLVIVRALRIAVNKPAARVEMTVQEKSNAEKMIIGIGDVMVVDFEDEN